MNRLAGKRAVITGAGSGIGRASALRFAEEGAAVLVVGRSSANTDETVALIQAAGGRAAAMVTDVTVEANVEAIVARCVAEFGGLDVFFANAGWRAPTRRCSSRAWRSGTRPGASTPSAASSR
jgi:NAD(P)-dependent dehydrogenase (short-subunit alcohol dehydrogenase family)